MTRSEFNAYLESVYPRIKHKSRYEPVGIKIVDDTIPDNRAPRTFA